VNPPDSTPFKKDLVIHEQIRGHDFTFHSTWGLFSPKQLDEGSLLLLNHFDVEPAQNTLDLGCGYGVIGLSIARQCPQGRVHMVDRDFVAVDYARRNAELNGLTNTEAYLSNAFSAVPLDMRFNNVVSNLPAKVGKDMLSIIVMDAWNQLEPGGRLCVVTIAGLREWCKRNFRDIFGNYKKLKQGKTYAVSMAVKEA
jgi:16S rRNA (guanine1207-N2)-methyltransferase